MAISHTALMEASADPYKAVQGGGRGQVQRGLYPQAPDHLGKRQGGSSLQLRRSGRGLTDGATLPAARGPSPWAVKGYLSDEAGVDVGGIFMRFLKAAPPRSWWAGSSCGKLRRVTGVNHSPCT